VLKNNLTIIRNIIILWSSYFLTIFHATLPTNASNFRGEYYFKERWICSINRATCE